MKTKKGVTLLELIIVVVIIGVIASVAIPSYQGVVRRTQVSKALHAMSLIAQAQKIVSTQRLDGAFVPIAIVRTANATIGDAGTIVNIDNRSGINLTTVDQDTHWTYTVSAAGVITATGLATTGQCDTRSFTYDINDNSHTQIVCP